ncbi:YifB family Mg chelatase-like AAA ATPase [Clostridium sp. AM58-1XD]|uniref:YifB family Mg chelatase-like AAA ATPase n=1 Tax=Clostridium sp. AM58-1XD TaxID=2292307 RepID=UPI000E51A714|nr:YifB family Mg chelatase-like AAA ATPase [Clostridium sp. AM58-1XD]RGY95447.1 ATP-binding protein [Clostridium sp. AM58-1XD]
MFSKVNSAGIMGIEGYLVGVEADVGNGLPGFSMVGYLAAEVREARDRVQTALKNSGFQLNARKITINLSPADIRKDGTAYDLPIAVAVLAAFGTIRQDRLKDVVIAGELGLDGEVKEIHGSLSMALAAGKAGLSVCFFPKENVKEAKAAGNIRIIGVSCLKELVELLNHPESIQEEAEVEQSWRERDYPQDFSEVNGQSVMRRATEIAVSGMHNILYIGPAGTGKSMIAKRIPSIMPPLSREESMEITKVYSVCGLLPKGEALLTARPFRSPHHSITRQAMAGGGRVPKPGEISLASRGVLFLDELPEFSSEVLELLRQPMEDRKITISRLRGSWEFPADTMVAAAMNPCPCGYFPDRRRCRCSPDKIKKYLSKISGPLLDRLDICVEAAPVTYEMARQSRRNESSGEIRKRVETARNIQRERFTGTGIYFNSEMRRREIQNYCLLGKEEETFLKEQFYALRMSARSCDKILKVARTIADLDGTERIGLSHLCEAAGYRSLEEKYWGRSGDHE